MQVQWLGHAEVWLWYANLAVTLALLLSLTGNGLFRVYKWLFIYLAAGTLKTVALMLVQTRINLYGWVYMGTQFCMTVLAVCVILELYRLALEGSPAIASFGQKTVRYVLGAAAILAIAGLLLDPSVSPAEDPSLRRLLSFERTMDTWMLTFLIIISAFMAWFPVKMKRNAIFYIGGFVAYFFSQSAGLLALNWAPGMRDPLNIAMLTLSVSCLVVWLFALQRKGEERTAVVGHSWNPAAMGRLTGQLEAINTRLLRLSRQ